MKKSVWLWIIAFVIAAFAGHYQRTTGPTYPISGRATLGAGTFGYRLERTHAGPGDQRVTIEPGAPGTEGTLEWRMSGSGAAWSAVPMRREGEILVAEVPHQPAGGKVEYRVILQREDRRLVLPTPKPGAGPRGAVLRFRGNVPAWVLIPHILAMIGALLLAARAALEIFMRPPGFRKLTDWTLAVLLLGGFVLGPVVSWYAFGAPWTGFPVGNDPTDSKTLLALVGWLAAAVAVRRAKHPAPWVVFAAVVMFLVYLIPHSIAAPR